MTKRRKSAGTAARKTRVVYAAEHSVGHQIRQTHRALQRALEARIRPYGITLGMWYFLRVLWEEDGLNQRELSARAGTAEPTTVTALHAMERRGLVVRVQNRHDRRKSNIFLTKPGRELRNLLLPEARAVNRVATAGLSAVQIEALKRILIRVRANLAARGRS
ncbi:MAG: MarR family transcriptional regulator [Alphaproteobacteria bacterium]|nr:MarR family transcriptional regulator [Alphaproteobacteria bacterium]